MAPEVIHKPKPPAPVASPVAHRDEISLEEPVQPALLLLEAILDASRFPELCGEVPEVMHVRLYRDKLIKHAIPTR